MTYTEFSDCSCGNLRSLQAGGSEGLSLFLFYENAIVCLKNYFRNLQAPTLRYILPSFGCRSPLRRPHSDKIFHKLGLVAHEKLFSDTL